VSLVNDKVAILATSQEIKDAELRQAINNVANDVGIIATTFIEYRNKLMSFDLKNSSPSELIDKFMPEMRNKVDALYKSCNSAAAKLEKFLSETPLRPND
jgi:hypothetical protein